MRIAIAAVGFAGLAYVFCCQNAGAVAVSETAIKQAADASSLVTQTGFTAAAIASVIGSWSSVPMSAGAIGCKAPPPRTDRDRLTGARAPSCDHARPADIAPHSDSAPPAPRPG